MFVFRKIVYLFLLLFFLNTVLLARESDKWTPLPDTPEADFLYNEDQQKKDNEHKSDSNKNLSDDTTINKNLTPNPDNSKWDSRKEYRPDPIMDLLEKYSDSYSKKIFTIARDGFSYALKTRLSDKNKIKSLARKWKEKIYTNEKYLWQKKDRQRKQKKYLQKLNRKSLQKYINNQVKVIKYLDKIVNRKVLQSKSYKVFKSDVFREYIKAQMSLHHYAQAIPFLEKYLRINDENKKEAVVHQYLAFCYANQEKAARKAKSDNRVIRYFNKKKSTYLLNYAALKYGQKSRQYRELFDKIEQENIELLN